MANQELVTGTINPQVYPGVWQAFKSSQVVDFSNNPVDLSGYTGWVASMVPVVAGPANGNIEAGTAYGDSSGFVHFDVDENDFADKTGGQCRLNICAVAPGGSELQLVAGGILTNNRTL